MVSTHDLDNNRHELQHQWRGSFGVTCTTSRPQSVVHANRLDGEIKYSACFCIRTSLKGDEAVRQQLSGQMVNECSMRQQGGPLVSFTTGTLM